ncbi:hypothetical protein [Streptomyces sp. VRA16 Mangrove soil]|uniref:hypothetical protein n=1 Tax=Streptomyces sp. VRA16 Mangrove soil TaxID=2817434 RepID=UPI001A9E97C4|nr:hypothetical protein [Streptomyces sp. VRA16 Mangrove soil]MBO1334032.1 hypothetical protein [Streptomyces sp. VRA16 Mangrove soil]
MNLPTLPCALYARSRAAASTLAAIVGAALFTLWAATLSSAFVDPYERVPLIALAPLIASSAIGVSLHQYAQELDRAAARPWRPLRLAHLLALTALAAALLALAVPGHGQEYGAAAMVRNVLGATGITAGAAAVIGARLSWLPTVLYFCAVYLSYSAPYLHSATLWTWSMQPGPQPGAWAVALTAFVLGAGAYVVRGLPARREPA